MYIISVGRWVIIKANKCRGYHSSFVVLSAVRGGSLAAVMESLVCSTCGLDLVLYTLVCI